MVFHGGNMYTQADSPLKAKISELEFYLSNNYPDENLKIKGFLDDLKAIEPNLSILGLLNHLSAMYREGSTLEEIVDDVNKTKKVFSLAGEYVKALENDRRISDLSEEIHQLIITQLEKALQLYQDEYDLSR